jgi:hypothetical protein
MVTAQHQTLIAETLKSMTPLELQSLLEEVAPHFKRERLIPILKKAFDFQEFEHDIDDLESKIDDLETEAYENTQIIEDVAFLCMNAKETDSAETLFNYITEILGKVS